MKVAIVSNFPAYSGTGKVSYQLWQELCHRPSAQADFFLTHFMNKRDHGLPEYGAKGVRILQPFDYMDSPTLSRLFLYFVDPYLLPKGYDIYHFGNHMIARFASIRRPSVVTVHDVLQFKYPEVFESKYISKIYNYFMEKSIKSLPKANHLICVSRWSEKELLNIFKEIDPKKISVVYNGLDHSIFYPRAKEAAREKLGWDPNKKYLLHLGSEIARKQIPLLFRSFKVIKELFPEAILVRHGEQKEETRKLIKELGLENEVIYYGYTPEKDLADFYSGADALLQPSSEEGFCFPVIEAMACGLPVVSSNRASLPEVCGGAEAAVMENLEEEDLVGAVSSLLKLGSANKEIIIKRGFENAQRFSWQKTAREIYGVYEEIVSKKTL